MTKEELEKAIIENVQISHSWMVEGITHTSDEQKGTGNYSPELEHAILTQELIDLYKQF